MNMYTKIVNNGVNVGALMEAREALSATPEAAQFTWRATCHWVKGTHSYSEIEGYYGLGEEQRHKKRFTFDADHPETFAADDQGATPVEYVLVGLASCLTTGVASVAQHRNIQLHSVKAMIEGDMDVQGVLGMDKGVRNGFESINVIFEIKAYASHEEIEALVAQSQKRSAVYDILSNPTNIMVETMS